MTVYRAHAIEKVGGVCIRLTAERADISDTVSFYLFGRDCLDDAVLRKRLFDGIISRHLESVREPAFLCHIGSSKPPTHVGKRRDLSPAACKKGIELFAGEFASQCGNFGLWWEPTEQIVCAKMRIYPGSRLAIRMFVGNPQSIPLEWDQARFERKMNELGLMSREQPWMTFDIVSPNPAPASFYDQFATKRLLTDYLNEMNPTSGAPQSGRIRISVSPRGDGSLQEPQMSKGAKCTKIGSAWVLDLPSSQGVDSAIDVCVFPGVALTDIDGDRIEVIQV